jgi:hypothetical protein
MSLSFDIANDIIDFDGVPELCSYEEHAKALRDGRGYEHYDRWSDRYMKLETNPTTGVPRLTLKWDEDCGFNFETIYLKWKLPKGCRVMDTVDRLGGYVFSSTAVNLESVSNNVDHTPQFDIKKGHVVVRVEEPGTMYLGLEHSTTKRVGGYVLVGLVDAIKLALENALTESEIRSETSKLINE